MLIDQILRLAALPPRDASAWECERGCGTVGEGLKKCSACAVVKHCSAGAFIITFIIIIHRLPWRWQTANEPLLKSELVCFN